MSRFVILIHDHPFLHWDLLLENGSVCRTWRLLTIPDPTQPCIAAEELQDHRLHYLDYEGPISGQRGTVTRWDAGSLEWIENRPDVCEVLLSGSRWPGRVLLTRLEGNNWQFVRISTGPQPGTSPNRSD